MSLSDKKQLLLDYAENVPLDDFPGFNYILTVDSRYVRMSNNALPVIGYQKHDQVYDTDYFDMPCKASENADIFLKEDKIVVEKCKEIKTISYHKFDHWRAYIGQKKPIVRDSQVIGQIFHFVDITETGLIDIGRFLLKDNKYLKKNQFSYIIQSDFYCEGLTQKEEQCLFFYLRGYLYREIGSILNINVTTVTTHLEHVKEKLQVNNRSQLIEKSISLGLMCVVPGSLLK